MKIEPFKNIFRSSSSPSSPATLYQQIMTTQSQGTHRNSHYWIGKFRWHFDNNRQNIAHVSKTRATFCSLLWLSLILKASFWHNKAHCASYNPTEYTGYWQNLLKSYSFYETKYNSGSFFLVYVTPFMQLYSSTSLQNVCVMNINYVLVLHINSIWYTSTEDNNYFHRFVLWRFSGR